VILFPINEHGRRFVNGLIGLPSKQHALEFTGERSRDDHKETHQRGTASCNRIQNGPKLMPTAGAPNSMPMIGHGSRWAIARAAPVDDAACALGKRKQRVNNECFLTLAARSAWLYVRVEQES